MTAQESKPKPPVPAVVASRDKTRAAVIHDGLKIRGALASLIFREGIMQLTKEQQAAQA